MDAAAWHYDSKGLFSVKSAYRVQRDYEKSSRRGVTKTVFNGRSYGRSNVQERSGTFCGDLPTTAWPCEGI